MKGQVGFEYLIVVGMVVLFLIPVWAYMTSVNNQASHTLYISQAEVASKKIISASDLVYTQGEPAQVTVDIYFPKGIQQSDIFNNTIRLRLYGNAGGVTDVAATSLGNMSGSLPRQEGLYKFVIKAVGNYVNISY